MFDLRRVVDLQQVVARELDVGHGEAVLEEVDRELRAAGGTRLGGLCERVLLFACLTHT